MKRHMRVVAAYPLEFISVFYALKEVLSMARKIDWESQIGRRLKLRDLHVFVTIVQRGSMAKAAAQLGVSQSAVSGVIAELEHAVGVRLLDRSPRGVEATTYGRALLMRSQAAFDELKQGIRDIEFLADPTMGEVRIGCAESTASAMLPALIRQFLQQYPRVVPHVIPLVTPTSGLSVLRDRTLDLVVARLMRGSEGEDDDLHVEALFDDRLILAAGKQNHWCRRRTIDLAELVDEPWILTPPNTWNSIILAEAFQLRGLVMPKPSLVTFSVPLRADLLAHGPFITAFPSSIMHFSAEQLSVKVLPVDLSVRPWPVSIVTLKNRILSPVAQRFIDHLRAFTRSMALSLASEKKSA
jgi:DNA-binding transcriptional LysR family regulator